MASCTIIVEKIMSHYLLIEIDQDQAPKQTEEESKSSASFYTMRSLDVKFFDHVIHWDYYNIKFSYE